MANGSGNTVYAGSGSTVDASGGSRVNLAGSNTIINIEGDGVTVTKTATGGNNVAVFSGAMSDYAITERRGVITITNSQGHQLADTLSGVLRLQFSNANRSTAVTDDFNGDGISDIPWTNASTGQVMEWLMANGSQASNTNLLTSTPGLRRRRPCWRPSNIRPALALPPLIFRQGPLTAHLAFM